MRELYLLRHAKAEIGQAGHADRDRALAPRGRRASAAIGAHMAARKMAPELALCSTALRTRETLDLVLASFPKAPQVAFEDDLYLAEGQALLDRLREVSKTVQRVLLVGHNPGIHELAHHLARNIEDGMGQALAASFPTGALARYEVEGNWSDLDRRISRLVGYVTPKEIGED